jgi:hypothetical protein
VTKKLSGLCFVAPLQLRNDKVADVAIVIVVHGGRQTASSSNGAAILAEMPRSLAATLPFAHGRRNGMQHRAGGLVFPGAGR